jgi:hypothetical protein
VGEDQCRYDVREMKSDSAPVDGCQSEEIFRGADETEENGTD